MSPSPDLLAFVKGWEGCRLWPYLDSAGRYTIGYGHLMASGDRHEEITQQAADAMFASDVDATSRALAFHVSSEPSQQQWDALVSLAFNEGVRAISQSTLLMHVNRSEWDDAAYQFPKWCYEHRNGELVQNQGLFKRRLAEQAIFRNGNYSARP